MYVLHYEPLYSTFAWSGCGRNTKQLGSPELQINTFYKSNNIYTSRKKQVTITAIKMKYKQKKIASSAVHRIAIQAFSRGMRWSSIESCDFQGRYQVENSFLKERFQGSRG